jgi:hypothetical protein
MRIILSESQYKIILVENIIKDTLKDLKINSGLLFTFGTGIASMLGPVERLLSGSGISLNEKEIILLIVTSIALLIKDADSATLLEKVREKNLMKPLKGVINLVSNTKDIINSVSKKLIGVTYSLLDILGFALLLNPTMKVIDEVITKNNITIDSTQNLLTGVTLATIVYTLKSVFLKLKNKIKNINEEIEPSDLAKENICKSEKFCKSQGPITFGQLRSIVESASKKRLGQHIGEGGFKATLRLLPWFLPQLAVAGFLTSAIRAVNKILKPTIEETDNYKTWWGKVVLRVFKLSEGELNLSDPFSRIFFISDGLMTMLNDRYKIKFAKYISEISSKMPDDAPVPEFYVENELRHWLNEKFLLDPPLQPKNVSVENVNESVIIKEDVLKLTDSQTIDLLDELHEMGYSDEDADYELDRIYRYYMDLPKTIILYRIVFADSEESINTEYPGDHYSRNKANLKQSHYMQSFRDSSYGNECFIIKVKAQKQLIDVFESMKNNILYPNEQEITLKNKGFGAKLVSIEKVLI